MIFDRFIPGVLFVDDFVDDKNHLTISPLF